MRVCALEGEAVVLRHGWRAEGARGAVIFGAGEEAIVGRGGHDGWEDGCQAKNRSEEGCEVESSCSKHHDGQ